MHEFSLLAALIKKIETIAHEQEATKVVTVAVKLGALSHISADHFREHFSHAITGTVAAEATLEIEVGTDENAADAQDIVLKSLEVED